MGKAMCYVYSMRVCAGCLWVNLWVMYVVCTCVLGVCARVCSYRVGSVRLVTVGQYSDRQLCVCVRVCGWVWVWWWWCGGLTVGWCVCLCLIPVGQYSDRWLCALLVAVTVLLVGMRQ